jgi:hypothetical protein
MVVSDVFCFPQCGFAAISERPPAHHELERGFSEKI